jgi:predicted ABC-type exoprotein transport system permease subunit
MMAAFIVAIRGTLKQAILLGLAATLSHTAVVWLIAMAGLWFGRGWDAHTSEPWFQLISGVLIVAIALWMAWRTWKRASRTIIIITTMITTTMTMTTIMTMTIIMIITTTNTRWLKKSGRTPTSALMRRILTGASAVKTSPPDRS